MAEANNTDDSNDMGSVVHKLTTNHDVVVTESTQEIEIGGRRINYKKFIVSRSSEMEKYLNQQALIKAASPLVQQQVIDGAMNSFKSMFSSGGSSKKMMKNLSTTLSTLLIAPNPSNIFGGPCDDKVDKKVCTGAIMARIQQDIPAVIPSLFMDNFFDDDDDDDDTTGGANTGPALKLM